MASPNKRPSFSQPISYETAPCLQHYSKESGLQPRSTSQVEGCADRLRPLAVTLSWSLDLPTSGVPSVQWGHTFHSRSSQVLNERTDMNLPAQRLARNTGSAFLLLFLLETEGLATVRQEVSSVGPACLNSAPSKKG